MRYDTIIIGGGASGLMTAALLPPKRALLIEGNERLGAKIKVSGGGRCNLTNVKVDATHYAGEATFVEEVLRRFDNDALLRFLERKGLRPIVRKKGQYFCPNRSDELLKILIEEASKQTIRTGETVLGVEKKGDDFEVRTTKQTYRSCRVVVASGGLSYPKLGASSIGYEIAERFGHTVVPTSPALVGFTVQPSERFFKELSGISLDAVVHVGEKRFEDAVLFAHKGISGPAILNASLYWRKGTIEIDFLPGFAWQSIRTSRKVLSSLLPMPKRAAKAFLARLEIEDEAAYKVSKETFGRLENLRRYRFAPAGTFGYGKAEATRGGVSTDEVSFETMESRKTKGLYFTGEVLDVTGELGGYNFQWAFSSAYVCAEALSRGRYACQSF